MNEPAQHLRIARPARNPETLVQQYAAGLGFERLGGFRDHDGFDGAMVGAADLPPMVVPARTLVPGLEMG